MNFLGLPVTGGASPSDLTELEQKTQNLTASVGESSFAGGLSVNHLSVNGNVRTDLIPGASYSLGSFVNAFASVHTDQLITGTINTPTANLNITAPLLNVYGAVTISDTLEVDGNIKPSSSGLSTVGTVSDPFASVHTDQLVTDTIVSPSAFLNITPGGPLNVYGPVKLFNALEVSGTITPSVAGSSTVGMQAKPFSAVFTKRVLGLVSPTDLTDATTRQYVDAKDDFIIGVAQNNAIAIDDLETKTTHQSVASGETTFNSIVHIPVAHATVPTHVTNKSYVDAAKNFVDLTPTTQPADIEGRVFYSSYWKKLIYYNGTRWLIVGDIPFFTPLAFDVGAGCTLCVSLRKLDGWAGSCCRVVREDNEEADIGFDTTGILDKVAFDAFIGTSTARVTRIYDQSGNNHDMLDNALSAGTRISVAFRLIDGVYIPEFEFDGNQYMLTPLTMTLGMTDNNHFVLANFRDEDLVGNETTIVGSFTGDDTFHQMTIEADGTGTIGQDTFEYTNIALDGFPFNGNYHTVGMSKSGADAYMRLDGKNSAPKTAVETETNDIQLRWGSRVGAVGKIDKWSNELIIWSVQPTTTILTNIESGMMNIWR
jgi:hypothetical protein